MGSLRVATLNVWGKGSTAIGAWSRRLPVLRRALAALEVDVVGLQEVTAFDAARAPIASSARSTDQAAEIADGLGLVASFGAAVELGFGFSFGNAVLSRHPIVRSETTRLPTDHDAEHRVLHSVLVDAPCGHVLFASTHLSWRADHAELRMRQVVAAIAELERQGAGHTHPAILVGDFNAAPESDEMRFVSRTFLDAFAEVGTGPANTWEHTNDFARLGTDPGEPDRRIDYVLVHRAGGARPVACRRAFDEAAAPGPFVPPVFASDHFGVFAEVRFASTISGPLS